MFKPPNMHNYTFHALISNIVQKRIDPVASTGSGGEFREANCCAQASYLRAIGLRWGLLQTPKSPFQLKVVPRSKHARRCWF